MTAMTAAIPINQAATGLLDDLRPIRLPPRSGGQLSGTGRETATIRRR